MCGATFAVKITEAPNAIVLEAESISVVAVASGVLVSGVVGEVLVAKFVIPADMSHGPGASSRWTWYAHPGQHGRCRLGHCFRKTLTLVEPEFVTAKSARPVPVKSPTATCSGKLPTGTGDPGAAAKPPWPSPSNMLTLLSEPEFDTARSATPLPLKSPTATNVGLVPTVTEGATVKVPSPCPSNMLTHSRHHLAPRGPRRHRR